MATLAVFLFPEKVGIARVKAPGFKPSYSSVQWRIADNVPQLLSEPLLLAGLVREMVGDDGKYDIYLNVHPGAYSSVMFSYDKKGKGDVKRLRQSELETVFHGELTKLYTLDLPMAKGKPGIDGKCRQVILAFPKERLHLMKESFKQQKMQLKRIAPMDFTAAESILKYWNPKDREIHVAMVLDEGCTSITFIKDGVIHAIRTIPNGFGSVLATYEHVTGQDHDTCLDMIRSNGVNVTAEHFDMPAIQDDVMRMLNRITGETVKTLHNTFGDEAVIGKIMLCGNFVSTVGLVEYLNTMLNTECAVESAETLDSGVKSAIVLDEKDLDDLFILAATTAKGADLMAEMKKNKSDKATSIVVCTLLTLVVGGMMAITPVQMHQLQQERDTLAHLLDQPEYATVSQLIDERNELNRHKNKLAEAIANLPHGGTNTAGMVKDIIDITTDYGTVLEVTTDYGTNTIFVSFSTLNYDSFIYWQKEIAEGGRFSFIEPPTFSGNGLIYTVEANMTATDFEPADEAEQTESAEGIG